MMVSHSKMAESHHDADSNIVKSYATQPTYFANGEIGKRQ